MSVEFSSKSVEVAESSIKLQIWDTAGQEKFKAISKSYYQNAIGIIGVFDLTRIDTFNHIESWVSEAAGVAKPNAVVAIVGNKSDMEENRQVTLSEVASFCAEHEYLHFETSSLTGSNVELVFQKMARKIHEKIINGVIDKDDLKPITKFKPIEIEKPNTNVKGCCY